mgnify:CR=1 FL=1
MWAGVSPGGDRCRRLSGAAKPHKHDLDPEPGLARVSVLPPRLRPSQIQIEGLPEDEASKGCWPSSEQLQALLTCRPGRPVNQQDIEGDVIRLLSTGAAAGGVVARDGKGVGVLCVGNASGI